MKVASARPTPPPAFVAKNTLPQIPQPATGRPMQLKSLSTPAGTLTTVLASRTGVIQRSEMSAKEKLAAKNAAAKALKEQAKLESGQKAVAEAKAKRQAKYLKKLPHLAGEEVNGELQGGHLISSMKKAHPNGIWLSRAPDHNNPWAAYWTDDLNRAKYKWSTFFPGSWTESDALGLATGTTDAPFEIFEADNTMYPLMGKQAAPPQPAKTAMQKA